jgi:hypothetical protein
MNKTYLAAMLTLSLSTFTKSYVSTNDQIIFSSDSISVTANKAPNCNAIHAWEAISSAVRILNQQLENNNNPEEAYSHFCTNIGRKLSGIDSSGIDLNINRES